jgi:predicted DCC family thiol-disulfide oxidoreductase YuxK
VQFVIRHDKKKLFRFAALQSEAGKEALAQTKSATSTAGSVILFYRGKYYTQSAAALHTVRLLGGFWQLLFMFILVPPFLRNYIYNVVAKNRYKWFGKRGECIIPTPELKERFIS